MSATDEGDPMALNPTSTQDVETDRPKIGFPYTNLDEAMHLTEAIHNNHGSTCDLAQLAAWLDTTVKSSKFRTQISAAKMFGLIEQHSKTATLTELGAAIVDPQRKDDAKAVAFLEIPLYRRLHDMYEGRMLPPDAGLEAEMRTLGVSPKSVSKARQSFQRSASSAGFFAAGKDRLVRPAPSGSGRGAVHAEQQEEQPSDFEEETKNQDQVGPSDPLLTGLWSKLPAVRPFSPAERLQWLELMRLALDLVYGEDEEKVAPKAAAPAKPAEPTTNAANTEQTY